MATVNKKLVFSPHAFLSSIGEGRDLLSVEKKPDFRSGSTDRRLYFMQKRKIQLTVISEGGKEATLGILSDGDFFGEGGLAGQPLRMSSAVAMTDCVLLHVEKKVMRKALTLEPKLSALFVRYLRKRNIRYQDDLIDQRFNSSEKRLARVLPLMAQFGTAGVSEMTIPKSSQETLAEMVATTRSRGNFFMNRLRKLGFINYDRGDNLRLHSSLLNVVLQDDENAPFLPARTLTPATGKNAEPPRAPGGGRRQERARRPPLPMLERRWN
jgi:CRP-like cAMP-binding protein